MLDVRAVIGTPLYHYTCSCAEPLIRRDGKLIPPMQQARPPDARRMPARWRWLLDLLWFTDMETPDRRALGLTQRTLRCDRTEFRVTVARDGLVPWGRWAALHGVPQADRDELELGHLPGPAHWWLIDRPVPVLAGPIATNSPRFWPGMDRELVRTIPEQ